VLADLKSNYLRWERREGDIVLVSVDLKSSVKEEGEDVSVLVDLKGNYLCG
jgi:hypothetical protein